jgi:hypothetical protein
MDRFVQKYVSQKNVLIHLIWYSLHRNKVERKLVKEIYLTRKFFDQMIGQSYQVVAGDNFDDPGINAVHIEVMVCMSTVFATFNVVVDLFTGGVCIESAIGIAYNL